MKIWFRVATIHQCSWTIVWNYLRKAFRANGYDLFDDYMSEPDNPDEYVELWWGNPADWSWSNNDVQLRVGMCVSEAESLLLDRRSKAIANLKRCDMLICPSNFSARAYRESPVGEIPITVVPLGVESTAFEYVKRDWKGNLIYLMAGAAQSRKGTWLGIEGFLKACHRKRAKLVIWSSVMTPEREALKREYAKNDKIVFDDRVLESPYEVYTASHIIISPHLSEGFGLCVAGDTLLTTLHGMIPIKQVVVGDFVLASNGAFEEIQAKSVRKTKNIQEVTVRGCEPIRITGEHPVAIWEQDSISWRNAKDLEKGDKVLIPLPFCYGELSARYIDLCDYVNIEKYVFDDECIYSAMGFSPYRSPSIATISKELDYPKHVVERALREIGTGQTHLPHYRHIQAYALLVGYKKPMPNKVKRNVLVNDDFLKFIGWYLAEGSSNPERRIVTFSLGSTELDIANFLREYAEQTFGVRATIAKSKYKNVITVTISNSALAEFMVAMCGDGAIGKRIHPNLFVFADKLLPLARAFIDGDGSVDKKRRCISYTTISKTLAYQIRYILLLNGFWTTIKQYPPRELGNYPIYKCTMCGNTAASYYGWEQRRNNNVCEFVEWNSCKYVIVPVKSNECLHRELLVYNVEIENDNTFVANSILVHNCSFEAMATGMPCIMARCSSPLEYFSTDYGWWIEMSELYAPIDKCLEGTGGSWRLPDVDSIADAVSYSYKHRDECESKGQLASEYVHQKLSWTNTANQIFHAVKAELDA